MLTRSEINKSRTKRWTKRRIALIVFAVSVIGFFCVFNTSTRSGRWLYWQDIDAGDIERFAFRVVNNDPENVHQFEETGDIAAVRKAIGDFRINDETIDEFAESHESTALIIVYDNQVVLERYYQGCQQDSLQMSVSCSKSVVSLLVGIAIDDGLINSLDAPITDYVDGLSPEFENVSIRHLMSMTSGISDNDQKLFDAIPAPWSDKVSVYYDPNLRSLASSFTTDYPPGERFEYHDFNPVLVGMMLENATGKNLSQYLSEKIWKPIGMQFSAQWSWTVAATDLKKRNPV